MLCEMHTHGSQVFLSILFWKITGKEEMSTEKYDAYASTV